MPESASQPELPIYEQADILAGTLFDGLVADALSGNDPKVVVDWFETGSVDDAHGLILTPNVTIMGGSVENFLGRIMKYSGSSPELTVAVGEAFTTKMAYMWEDTLEEMKVLDTEIDALAMSRKSGYADRVVEGLRSAGLDTNIGDGELLAAARLLAIEDLGVWVAAIEAETDPEEPEELDRY